jgi:pilus assembly protein CpaC
MEEFLEQYRLAASKIRRLFMTVLSDIMVHANNAIVSMRGKKQAWIYCVVALGCFLLGFLIRPPEFASGFFFSSSKLDTAVDVPPDAKAAVDVTVSHGRIVHFDEPLESVFLGDPSIADLRIIQPDTVYIFGKRLGTTNLIAVSGSGSAATPAGDKSYIPPMPPLQATLRIRVVADSNPPNEARQELASGSVAKIALFGRRAVAMGHAKNIDDAVNIQEVAKTYSGPGQPPINAMTLAGSQQVNLRVRFAEISRADVQTLGINWQMFNTGNFSFAPLPGNSSRNANADALIDLLQRNGVLTILAEPNLTAISGQTASFLAGGEIPIPVAQSGGTVTTEFKTFGVSLVFTPTLIKKNRIALHIHPEVSMLSMATGIKVGGVETPVIMVHRTDTTVELGSGQTFAIGGLFQRQISQSGDDMDKLNFFGDLPVIGALFRSPRFRRNETELVILVTAYVVSPVSNRMVATPLDKSSDALRALQQLHAADRAGANDAAPRSGPAASDTKALPASPEASSTRSVIDTAPRPAPIGPEVNGG